MLFEMIISCCYNYNMLVQDPNVLHTLLFISRYPTCVILYLVVHV